ncbi:putative DNA-binding transcriptional regulator AlpA [Bradyrhizobium sp. S3.2.12]
MLSLNDACAMTGMRPYELNRAIATESFPRPSMCSGRELFYSEEIELWIKQRARRLRLGTQP